MAVKITVAIKSNIWFLFQVWQSAAIPTRALEKAIRLIQKPVIITRHLPKRSSHLQLLTSESSPHNWLEDEEVGPDVDVDVVVAGNHVAAASQHGQVVVAHQNAIQSAKVGVIISATGTYILWLFTTHTNSGLLLSIRRANQHRLGSYGILIQCRHSHTHRRSVY